jgi:hypothetical protein
MLDLSVRAQEACTCQLSNRCSYHLAEGHILSELKNSESPGGMLVMPVSPLLICSGLSPDIGKVRNKVLPASLNTDAGTCEVNSA